MTTRTWSVFAALLLGSCTRGASPSPTLAPDIGRRMVAANGMVTSAHPAASEAGLEMLRRGGNAVDAAVATAFALGVGEPQMSGLGGGGGMLIWLQREGRAEYLDFYSAQRAESWRGIGPMDSTVASLRVVGIPGEVAGLLAAHERYGKLTRADVMAPAIRLADEGFPVNQILGGMIVEQQRRLLRFPETARHFLPGGNPLQPGDQLKNPELAAALRRVAADGARGFYQGETAREVVRVLNAGGHPATLADFEAFAPQWKRPLCTEYRGYVVLSAPPPQTGLQLLDALNLLEPHDLRAMGYPTQSARAFDVLASAIRVSNADSRVNNDPNWAKVPAAVVTSKPFAAAREALVGTGSAAAQIPRADSLLLAGAAVPAPQCVALRPYRDVASISASSPPAPAPGPWSDAGETTHLSVVDGEGNAVALSQTNSSEFGSGGMASGFLLNDSGFDFSRAGGDSAATTGRSPWRIRPSTISPTIALRDGRVQLVVGSPGGGRIQPAILQTVVYVLDYGLDPLEAVRMPRMYPSAQQRVETENGFSASVLGAARGMGYVPTPEAGGYARVYVIARRGDRWIGAADPRHNGAVRGY